MRRPQVQARRTTEVNYFGTGNVTTSLLPLLRRSRLPGGARVVTVSSSAGSLSSFWSNVVHPARKVFYLPILTLQGLDDLVKVLHVCPGSGSVQLFSWSMAAVHA